MASFNQNTQNTDPLKVNVVEFLKQREINSIINGIRSLQNDVSSLTAGVNQINDNTDDLVDQGEETQRSRDRDRADLERYHTRDRASQNAIRGEISRGNKLAEIGMDLLRGGLRLITDSLKNSLRSIDSMVIELRKSRLSNEEIKKYSIATGQTLLNLSKAGYNVSRDTMNEYIRELVVSGRNIDAMIKEGTLDKYAMARFAGYNEELARQAIYLDDATIKRLADASYDPALIATIKAVSESIDDSTRAAFNNDPRKLMDAIFVASTSMVKDLGNAMSADQMAKVIVPALKAQSNNLASLTTDEIGALLTSVGDTSVSLENLGKAAKNNIKNLSSEELYVRTQNDLTKGLMSAVLNTSQAMNAGQTTGVTLKSRSQISQSKSDYSEKGLLQQRSDEAMAYIDVSTGALSEMSVSLNKYFGTQLTMEQVVTGGFTMVIDLLKGVTGGIGNMLSGALSGILSGVITRAGGAFLASLGAALGPVLAPLAVLAGVGGIAYGVSRLVKWSSDRKDEKKIAENSQKELEVALKSQEEAQENYENALAKYGEGSPEVQHLGSILAETQRIAQEKKHQADVDKWVADKNDAEAASFINEDLPQAIQMLTAAQDKLIEAEVSGNSTRAQELRNEIGAINQAINILHTQTDSAFGSDRLDDLLKRFKDEDGKFLSKYSNTSISERALNDVSALLGSEQLATIRNNTAIYKKSAGPDKWVTSTDMYGRKYMTLVSDKIKEELPKSFEQLGLDINNAEYRNLLISNRITNDKGVNSITSKAIDDAEQIIAKLENTIKPFNDNIKNLSETEQNTLKVYNKQIEELKKNNEEQKAARLEQERSRLSAINSANKPVQQASANSWFSSLTNGIFDKLKNKPFENGGIVSSTTPAVIGEAGKEAVLPLTKPDNIRSILSNLTTSEKLLLLKSLINKKGNLSGNDIVEFLAGIKKSNADTSTVLEQSEFTDKVLEGARRQYGKKYSEIVCNQLVEAALKYAGFKTPTTGVVTKHFNNPKMHLVLNDPVNGISSTDKNLLPGMIMFSHPFTQMEADQLNRQKGGNRKAGDPGHMGIYAGNGLWWNATSSKNTIDYSSGKGVRVTDSNKGFGVALTKPTSKGTYKLYAAGYYDGMFDSSITSGLSRATSNIPYDSISSESSIGNILESAKNAISIAMSTVIASSNTETRQAVQQYVQQAMSLLNGKNTSEVISSLSIIVKYLRDIASSPSNKKSIPALSRPVSSPY